MSEDRKLLDEDIDFEVNIRHDIHRFFESEWPSFGETSLLESAVIEAVENIQVSKPMAINCALGAMSTACQGRIQVQQPTGNVVNTNLMLLTIAESGERKTTVEKQFFKSIRDLQARASEDTQAKNAQNELAKLNWKTEWTALNSSLKKAKQKEVLKPDDEEVKANLKLIKDAIKEHNESEPKTITPVKFIYDDTTPQALVRMMHKHYRHACLLSSEANGIFNGRAFDDLHMLNSLWDGVDIPVDRISQPSFILSNARLTLALMTQMQVIESFLTKRGEEARGLGFLARFLVVRPPHMSGERDATAKLNNLVHLKNFNDRVQQIMLDDIKHQQNKTLTKNERDKKTILTFSAKASQYWNRYAQAIEDAQKEGQVYEFYKDHASKLMDNITRIAGLVHYFHDQDDTQINHATLEYAYQLGMRYSKHFLTYIADEPALIKNTKALIAYLYQPPAERVPEGWQENLSDRYNPNKQWQVPPCKVIEGAHYREGRVIKFTGREIRQFGPSMLRDPQKLYRVIELLKRMGFVTQQERGRKTHWVFYEATVFSKRELVYKDDFNPEFKNGHQYSISSLPLFEEIEPIENVRLDRDRIEGQQSTYVGRFGTNPDALQLRIRCKNSEAD